MPSKTFSKKRLDLWLGKIIHPIFIIANMSKKRKPKWKPTKRFVSEIIINPKAGKRKYKYIKAKTLEEEKKMEEDFDRNLTETIDVVLNWKESKNKKVNKKKL